MNVFYQLGILVVLSLLNGVLSGAEIAMLSVRKTRLSELAERGSPTARAALRLRNDPESLLATIQVGITVIGATTAVFGGAQLEGPLARFLLRMGFGAASEGVAFALVIGLVSYLGLVIGELVPKSLALRTPERFALFVARGLAGLSLLGRPIVWALVASSNVLLRPFRDRTTFAESRLSPDELQQLVEESAACGVLHPGAGDIASRAIDLGRLKANALMLPRSRIRSIDLGDSREAVLRILRSAPHARYPVVDGDEEAMVGYVLTRDVYDTIVRTGEVSIPTLVRPISFFPKSSSAIDVLRALQASRQQLGAIVEEHGSIVGLLSIEDIVEDVFGEILEEHETPRPLVHRDEADGSVVALGEAPVHEVSRLLGRDLAEGATAPTMAGLLTEKLGRLPSVGERVPLAPRIDAEVLEATPKRIVKVRIRVARDDEVLTEKP